MVTMCPLIYKKRNVKIGVSDEKMADPLLTTSLADHQFLASLTDVSPEFLSD